MGKRSSSRHWGLRCATLFTLLLCIVTFPGCQKPAEKKAPKKKPLQTIKAATLTIKPRPWPTIVRSQGSLVADEFTEIGAKVAGRVAEVKVDIGDVVSKGDVLITLEQADFELEVAQAEAQLVQARSAVGLKPGDAKSTLKAENSPPVRQEKATWDETKTNVKRSTRLFDKNAISQAELDEAAAAERVAEARYAAALNAVFEKIALIGVREAELSLAKQHLKDATIRAPYDGIVERKQVAPGTYVQVGDPVASVVRSNPLRFRGTIPERHAKALKVGQKVLLHIESVSEPRPVHVTRVSPALDQYSRSLLFEADVDNKKGELRVGLFVEAEVMLNEKAESLVIPPSAIVEFAGAEKVWKVVDGVAHEHEIVAGHRRHYGIEIVNGLSAGDVILYDGSQGSVAKIEQLPAPEMKLPQGSQAMARPTPDPTTPTARGSE